MALSEREMGSQKCCLTHKRCPGLGAGYDDLRERHDPGVPHRANPGRSLREQSTVPRSPEQGPARLELMALKEESSLISFDTECDRIQLFTAFDTISITKLTVSKLCLLMHPAYN